MNEEQIRQSVLQQLAQIAPEADLDALGDELNIREELEIDSYDFLTLLVGLNEKWKIEIPEADYEQLVSLADIVRYLSLRLP